MQYDVFIGYKAEEHEYAEKLATYLAQKGLRVWWAARLLPGQRYEDEIASIISKSKAVVIIWSTGSVESDWVKAEARIARKQNKLIPINIDGVQLPPFFDEIQTLDLKQWLEDGDESHLDKLIAAIEHLTEQRVSPDLVPKEIASLRINQDNDDIQFWKHISTNPRQNVEEYKLYLEKYGSDAVFFELATLRMQLLSNQAKPKLSSIFGKSVYLLAALVTIVLGFVVFAETFKLGSNEKNEVPVLEDRSEFPDDEADILAEKQTISETESENYKELEETVEPDQKEKTTPQKNTSNIIVRIYAGRIQYQSISSTLRDLGVSSEFRQRNSCLEDSPVTSIWPDRSIDFGEFKALLIALIDEGHKFYVIHPKQRSAPNVIDIGSIVSVASCTIQFDYEPFTREEVLAAKHFCGGYRPSISLPNASREFINSYCFSKP